MHILASVSSAIDGEMGQGAAGDTYWAVQAREGYANTKGHSYFWDFSGAITH